MIDIFATTASFIDRFLCFIQASIRLYVWFVKALSITGARLGAGASCFPGPATLEEARRETRREERNYATEELRNLAERLRTMSYEDLASFRVAQHDASPRAVLADQELERRARLHQHELDRKLMMEQVDWMKFTTKMTAGATLIAAIVGAIAGAILTFWLQPVPSPARQESSTPPAQEQTGASTSADRVEKAAKVPSKSS